MTVKPTAYLSNNHKYPHNIKISPVPVCDDDVLQNIQVYIRTTILEPLNFIAFNHWSAVTGYVRHPSELFMLFFCFRRRTRRRCRANPRSPTSAWSGARWRARTATPDPWGQSSPRTCRRRRWEGGCGSWCTPPGSKFSLRIAIFTLIAIRYVSKCVRLNTWRSIRDKIQFFGSAIGTRQRPSGEKLITSALFSSSSDFCTLFHGLGVDCRELLGVEILDELLSLVDTPREVAFEALDVSQTPSLVTGTANRHKNIRLK